MPADPESLYGISRPHRRPEHEISSSTSSPFSSELTSLLAKSREANLVGSGRSRSARDTKAKKENIFTSQKSKKRAVAEISRDESGRVHQTQDVIGGVEEAVLRRSKRRMEEKARLYAAMKRGDYVDTKKGYVNDEDRGTLVDFDRKWAEAEEGGVESDADTSSDGQDSEGEEVTEYTDEYGRLRKGTRAEIARLERRRRIQDNATQELDDLSARPKMPTNLIYGDTVQASAFNPDAALERQMEELAARRDRSMTPPEETHYDASKEVRSKGVGFYQFSKDNSSRQKEMENLDESRRRTEQWEEERQRNREKKELDRSRDARLMQERKSERDANAFLKTLGSNLSGFVAAGQSETVKPVKKKKGWGK